MEKQQFLWLSSTLTVFLVLSVLVALSIVAPGVIGDTNSTTLTEVYIWNTEPNVTSVAVNPDVITLVPGTTTRINCTAIVWDYNGWDDVNITNATFYHESVTNVHPNNNNNHYSADPLVDCECEQVAGSPYNASCHCFFDIWYFANNGTWICNMTVMDYGGTATERIYRFNSSNIGYATINTLVGIYVTDYISYGNLSVLETSTDKELNITNFGNEPINVSVRAYGGTSDRNNPTNSSMICELGDMALDRERFSLNYGEDFDAMIPVTNTSTLISGLTVPVRTNEYDYSDSTNQTYWKLRVPLTVGGYCNGTLEFFASPTN